VLLRSKLQPTKSEFEYPVKISDAPYGYHSPTFIVPFKYFKILFLALKCDSFRFAWNLAHMQTLNIMSGRLAVRYSKEPINPLYFVWSIEAPFSSKSKQQLVTIGVEASLQLSISNLLRSSLQYLDWHKLPCNYPFQIF